MVYDLVIIGGGASGLACANIAKKHDLNFVILECANRVGRKILATGNGKCNLSNTLMSKDYYNNNFANSVINKYSPNQIIDFFASLGMLTKQIDGRIYPYTESSNTVLNCLINNIKQNIICNYRVNKIEKQDFFIINNQYQANNVVLATGSNATLGNNSLGLLDNFEHSYERFSPSLVWLKTDTKYIKGMSGLRARANVKLYNDNILLAQEVGEVLFKDNGISGIAIFMLSTHIARQKSKGNYTIRLDFISDLPEAQVKKYKLNGIVRERLAMNISQQAQDKGQSIEYTLKNFEIIIKELSDIKHAQVATGGYSLKEFDKDNLSSLLVPNLYITGEVLDIDGNCGGYNLHWAWASGITVGERIAKSLK